MMLIMGFVIILLISFIWALQSVNNELSVPEEVRSLKIKRKKKISGVILFLKKKIIHYVSSSS